MRNGFTDRLCLERAHAKSKAPAEEQTKALLSGQSKYLLIKEVIREIDPLPPPLDLVIHRDVFLIDLVGNTICADLMDYARRAKLSICGSRAVIEVVDANPGRARVSAAHEVGHYLIHLRDRELDLITLRSSTSPEEETLSEYIGRLLLLPLNLFQAHFEEPNASALGCLRAASRALVSIHASTARLVDPDHPDDRVRGAIFWKIDRRKIDTASLGERLTPYWHLCPGAFIPVGKCHARRDSLIVAMAAAPGDAHGTTVEEVQIGTLNGKFLVDVFAWGSVAARTRCVLSIFLSAN